MNQPTEKQQKRRKIWMKLLKFFFHFCYVMSIMVAGSFILIKLEENDDTVNIQLNETEMVFRIINDFNKDNDIDKFLQAIRETDGICNTVIIETSTKYKQFLKWFHFSNIVATTIGYGNIAPVTANGRIFFIGYAILIIPSMITLLARCGDIMTNINKLFFKVLRRFFFKKTSVVSDSFLSAISIAMIFIGYLHVGMISPSSWNENWSYLEHIYFWFVTFTTIGFGDVMYQINDFEYVVTIYRLFGLALLAGLVDSIAARVKERKKMKLRLKKMRENVKQRTDIAREKMKDFTEDALQDIRLKTEDVLTNVINKIESPRKDKNNNASKIHKLKKKKQMEHNDVNTDAKTSNKNAVGDASKDDTKITSDISDTGNTMQDARLRNKAEEDKYLRDNNDGTTFINYGVYRKKENIW